MAFVIDLMCSSVTAKSQYWRAMAHGKYGHTMAPTVIPRAVTHLFNFVLVENDTFDANQ